MKALSKIDLPVERPQETNESYTLCILESCGAVLTREDLDYQCLVKEKLKAAAEWDFRDSKQLQII